MQAWIEPDDNCVAFPDTKSGAQMRAAGDAAITLLLSQRQRNSSPFFFPAGWGEGHFICVVRVLDRVRARAGLECVTPHVLRHTFASIAASIGFSELTISGLLGHGPRGVRQRYIHLDTALVIVADQVAAEIARGPIGEGGQAPALDRVGQVVR